MAANPFRWFLVPVLAGITLLVVGPQKAQAQSTLYACYVPGSGVVYRVNPADNPTEDPDLPTGCRGGRGNANGPHVLFSWSGPGTDNEVVSAKAESRRRC